MRRVLMPSTRLPRVLPFLLFACTPTKGEWHHESEQPEGKEAAKKGQEPGAACVELAAANVDLHEVGSVSLRYEGACASASGRPCFKAQISQTDEIELADRQRTLVGIVYKSSDSTTGGEVPLTVYGPTDRAWRIKHAINKSNQGVWSTWSPEIAAGGNWSAPTGVGLDVGARHLAIFRAVIQTKNPDGSWGNDLDPLVILVPKRTALDCNPVDPYPVRP